MKNKRIKNIIILFLVLLILGITYLYLIKVHNIYIPCLFHKITGLYCPGCGATRCILSLIKGDLKLAFQYNPIFFILLPFLIFIFTYKIYLYIENKQDKIITKIPNFILIILIIILILFGILRNLEGFEFLRP